MSDHRRTLRAEPPKGRLPKVVQTRLDAETYAKLYALAKVQELSLSDLILQTLKNLVGTR